MIKNLYCLTDLNHACCYFCGYLSSIFIFFFIDVAISGVLFLFLLFSQENDKSILHPAFNALIFLAVIRDMSLNTIPDQFELLKNWKHQPL